MYGGSSQSTTSFTRPGVDATSTADTPTSDVTDWYKRTVSNSDMSKSGVSIRSGGCPERSMAEATIHDVQKVDAVEECCVARITSLVESPAYITSIASGQRYHD